MVTAPAVVDTETPAAIDRLNRRVNALEQLLAAARERNEELRTARDFADSVAAGYVDRAGLDA